MLATRGLWELVEARADASPDDLFAIDEHDRRLTFATARQRAEGIVDAAYQSRSVRWAIMSGKVALSRISGWSQQQFGVGFGPVPGLPERPSRNATCPALPQRAF